MICNLKIYNFMCFSVLYGTFGRVQLSVVEVEEAEAGEEAGEDEEYAELNPAKCPIQH